MSAVIGPHDPVLLSMRGETWVECECGWIGPSAYSEDRALAAHKLHAER